MENRLADIGMVGLGVMGCNLVLNMADHGYSVIGYDRDASKGQALPAKAGDRPIQVAGNMDELVRKLRPPRAVMMMVPAGPPVDAVMHEAMDVLSPGDILIDGGNSYFKDTDLRAHTLAGKSIQFLGVGISGGEDGARHGPSMMPGGPLEAYQRVQPVFEAIAARVNNEPCVTYLGSGSAGHYVKMVHNGIEYAMIQLIDETYDLMKRGLGRSDDDLSKTYRDWNQGKLSGYLIEITEEIFRQVDEQTGKRLIDIILDEASQKGTGKWTSEEAMEIQVPTPTIDIAVTMRNLSMLRGDRKAASQVYNASIRPESKDLGSLVSQQRRALQTAFVISFAQGFALLKAGSEVHGYALKLEDIARIWRGGCIIRTALLEDIRSAFHAHPALANLILDPQLGSQEILPGQADLRQVVAVGAQLGIPVPGFMASLAYLDAYRSEWLPANLTQAQRDYFGAHTYERIDEKGVFHTHWGHEFST